MEEKIPKKSYPHAYQNIHFIQYVLINGDETGLKVRGNVLVLISNQH